MISLDYVLSLQLGCSLVHACWSWQWSLMGLREKRAEKMCSISRGMSRFADIWYVSPRRFAELLNL